MTRADTIERFILDMARYGVQDLCYDDVRRERYPNVANIDPEDIKLLPKIGKRDEHDN